MQFVFELTAQGRGKTVLYNILKGYTHTLQMFTVKLHSLYFENEQEIQKESVNVK